MPEVTPLPAELSRGVSALARSLVAAARTSTLPLNHPAVRVSVERFGRTISDAGKHMMQKDIPVFNTKLVASV